MNFLKSIYNNLISLIESIRDALNGSIPYIGYHNNGNLGDEELFKIAKKYLPKNLCTDFHKRGRFLSLGLLGKKYYVVGGGSLIFGKDTLAKCKKLNSKGLKPIFLGTGASHLPSNKQIQSEWGDIINHSKFAAVRGNETVQLLKIINANSFPLGDIGYLSNFMIDTPFFKEDYIVICPRSINTNTYNLNEIDFSIRKLLFQVVNKLLQQGEKIKVISVSSDDHLIVREWLKQFEKEIEYFEYYDNFSTFFDCAKKAKLLVTMRMHPGIFAVSWGVPVISIDGRHKYKDSYNILPNSEKISVVLNPETTNVKEILTYISHFLNENHDVRNNRFLTIREFAKKQKKIIASIFNL